MQVFGSMPPYAVGGSCFVTQRSRVEPDERVICLDIDIETLSPFGILCVNSSAVKLMVNQLGWAIADDAAQEKSRKAQQRITSLRDENKVLRAALAAIAEAAAAIGIEHLLVEPEPVEELVST